MSEKMRAQKLLGISNKELKEIDEKIKSELEPFLDLVRTNEAAFKIFKEAFRIYRERMNHAYELTEFFMRDYAKLSKFRAKEEMSSVFVYLGLVESLGNSVVDMLVILLVATGYDFHIECRYRTPRIKHATSIIELENERVPLTTKLNFLRDCGITTFSSIIDSELRNTIAHLKFEVKDEQIYVKGKPAYKILYISQKKLLHAILRIELELINLAASKGIIPKKEDSS